MEVANQCHITRVNARPKRLAAWLNVASRRLNPDDKSLLLRLIQQLHAAKLSGCTEWASLQALCDVAKVLWRAAFPEGQTVQTTWISGFSDCLPSDTLPRWEHAVEACQKQKAGREPQSLHDAHATLASAVGNPEAGWCRNGDACTRGLDSCQGRWLSPGCFRKAGDDAVATPPGSNSTVDPCKAKWISPGCFKNSVDGAVVTPLEPNSIVDWTAVLRPTEVSDAARLTLTPAVQSLHSGADECLTRNQQLPVFPKRRAVLSETRRHKRLRSSLKQRSRWRRQMLQPQTLLDGLPEHADVTVPTLSCDWHTAEEDRESGDLHRPSWELEVAPPATKGAARNLLRRELCQQISTSRLVPSPDVSRALQPRGGAQAISGLWQGLNSTDRKSVV